MPQPPPQPTATELRKQMLDYLAETMNATGHPDGWYLGTIATGQRPWIPEEQKYSAFLCDPSDLDGARQYGQYVNHDADPDPIALAEKVVTRWQELGYPVSLVWAPSTKPGAKRMISYRADLITGVHFELFSSDDLIGIYVSSSCSTHSSMYHPDPS